MCKVQRDGCIQVLDLLRERIRQPRSTGSPIMRRLFTAIGAAALGCAAFFACRDVRASSQEADLVGLLVAGGVGLLMFVLVEWRSN
jgi:hypothetical protein